MAEEFEPGFVPFSERPRPPTEVEEEFEPGFIPFPRQALTPSLPTPVTPQAPTGEEFARTPEGAVTGRTAVPFPRMDVRGPLSPDMGTPIRLGLETGLGVLGEIGGARFGPQASRALGAAGTVAGSLLAQPFDPVKDVEQQAFLAGSTTFLAGSLGPAMRRLLGKPSEEGKFLLQQMEARGLVPTAGQVLESDFARSAEAVGSAAYGTSQRLIAARQVGVDISTEDFKNYVSGFQRFHGASKLAFKEAYAALGGQRLGIKVDPKVRDALKDFVSEQIRSRGSVNTLDSHLRKISSWLDDPEQTPTFSFEEVQGLYSSLYDKAFALDARAAGPLATGGEIRDAKFMRELASETKAAFDLNLDGLIKNKTVDPNVKRLISEGRATWNLWTQGQELESALLRASEDIKGANVVSGDKFINELDSIIRRQKKIGTTILEDSVLAGARRYALALRAAQSSGSEKFGFISRGSQYVGLGGLAVGNFFVAAAALPPHALAVIFSNNTMNSLMIRGLRLKPGSAEAFSVARRLTVLLAQERVLPSQRVEESGPVRAAMAEEEARRFVPE